MENYTVVVDSDTFFLCWLWTPDFLKLDINYKPSAVSASEQ